MKNPQNLNRLPAHPVWNDVRCTSNYQFAGIGQSARTSGSRMILKPLDAGGDTFNQSSCRLRIVSCDVREFLIKIFERAAQPSNVHRASTCS